MPSIEQPHELEETGADKESPEPSVEIAERASSSETLEAIIANPDLSWENAFTLLNEANDQLVVEKDEHIDAIDESIAEVQTINETRESLELPPDPESLGRIEAAVQDADGVIDIEASIAVVEETLTETHAKDPNEAVEVMRSKEAHAQRLLSEVCARNNQFILHGIRVDKHGLGYHPDENSQIRGDASFVERVKILRSLKPEISCSSFRFGTPYEGGWSSVGVLLSGGEVMHAARRDDGTRAEGDGTRSVSAPRYDSPRDVDEILATVNNKGYNELVIRNPMIAGMFVNFDKLQFEEERALNVEWQSKQVVASLRAKRNGTTEREEVNKIADDREYVEHLSQEERAAIDLLRRQVSAMTRARTLERAEKNWKYVRESNETGLPLFMIVDGRPREVADWDKNGPVFVEDLDGGVTPQTLDKYADPLTVEERKEILSSIPEGIFKPGKNAVIE